MGLTDGYHWDKIGGEWTLVRDADEAAPQTAAVEETVETTADDDQADAEPDVAPARAAGAKTCLACGLAKPRSAYYANPSGRDGLQSKCIPCFKAYCAAYRAKKRRERVEWHPEPVRPPRPSVSLAKDADGVEIERQCNRCREVKPLADFHKNCHSRGGRHTICRACQKRTAALRVVGQREEEKAASAAPVVAPVRKPAEPIDARADEVIVQLAAAVVRWRDLDDYEEREQAKAVVVYLADRLVKATGVPA